MTKPWADYQLADKVLVRAELWKPGRYIGPPESRGGLGEWYTYDYCYRRRDLEAPVEGYFMGWRTIVDVHRECEWDAHYGNSSCYYVLGGQHLVALVVFDPRRNPMKVPFDALEKV